MSVNRPRSLSALDGLFADMLLATESGAAHWTATDVPGTMISVLKDDDDALTITVREIWSTPPHRFELRDEFGDVTETFDYEAPVLLEFIRAAFGASLGAAIADHAHPVAADRPKVGDIKQMRVRGVGADTEQIEVRLVDDEMVAFRRPDGSPGVLSLELFAQVTAPIPSLLDVPHFWCVASLDKEERWWIQASVDIGGAEPKVWAEQHLRENERLVRLHASVEICR